MRRRWVDRFRGAAKKYWNIKSGNFRAALDKPISSLSDQEGVSLAEGIEILHRSVIEEVPSRAPSTQLHAASTLGSIRETFRNGRRVVVPKPWEIQFEETETVFFQLSDYPASLGKKLKKLAEPSNYEQLHESHVIRLNQDMDLFLAEGMQIEQDEFDGDKTLIALKRIVKRKIAAEHLSLLLALFLFPFIAFHSPDLSADSESEQNLVSITQVQRFSDRLVIELDQAFFVSDQIPISDEDLASCQELLRGEVLLMTSEGDPIETRDCSLLINSNTSNPYALEMVLQIDENPSDQSLALFLPEVINGLPGESAQIVKASLQSIGVRKLAVSQGSDPREIVLINNAPLPECNGNCSEFYEVRLTRGGGEPTQIVPIRSTGSAQTIRLRFPIRLRHGDKLRVVANSNNEPVQGNLEIKRPIQTLDNAETYIGVSLERDHEGEDRTVGVVDLKYVGTPRNVERTGLQGPFIDFRVDWDNRNRNSEKKVDLGISWRYNRFLDPPPDQQSQSSFPSMLTFRLGPRIELEDEFDNRNAVFSALVNHSNRWCAPFVCEPSLGVELGSNFGLNSDVDPDGEFEDYRILRGRAAFSLAYARELESGPFSSAKFGVSAITRYLVEDEIMRSRTGEQDESGKDIINSELDDGLRTFWQAELLLEVRDGIGFSLKHESGERPPFYLDSSTTTLGLAYSF